MNVRQSRVLVAAATLVVAMLLYPPFNIVASAPRSLATGRLVYQWLFAPPAGGHVDVGLLLAQWIAVGIVAGTVYLLLGNKK